MASIADHVMSTGLGLGNILGGSPPSPILSSDATSKQNQRRPSLPRRISSQPSPPLVAAGEPLMSAKDLHVVFANLEEMADLAEAFAGVLDGARGSGNEQDMADRMGEVFVEMVRSPSRVPWDSLTFYLAGRSLASSRSTRLTALATTGRSCVSKNSSQSFAQIGRAHV